MILTAQHPDVTVVIWYSYWLHNTMMLQLWYDTHTDCTTPWCYSCDMILTAQHHDVTVVIWYWLHNTMMLQLWYDTDCTTPWCYSCDMILTAQRHDVTVVIWYWLHNTMMLQLWYDTDCTTSWCYSCDMILTVQHHDVTVEFSTAWQWPCFPPGRRGTNDHCSCLAGPPAWLHAPLLRRWDRHGEWSPGGFIINNYDNNNCIERLNSRVSKISSLCRQLSPRLNL